MNSVGKVIFINRYFYPDVSATSQLLSDLVFDLARTRRVTVLTSRQTYEDPLASLLATETIFGVNVVRLWTSRFGRGHLGRRLCDYFTFYCSAAWSLAVLVKRGDIVVAKTDPPLISVIAAIVAKLKHATLINWVQDMFPEVALELKVGGLQSLGPALRRVRNFSLQVAGVNVVLGDRMAERVHAQGISRHQVRVIHNWSDGRQIVPISPEQNPLRSEWGLQDKFVVGYSGNMGRAHEFDTILQLMASFGQDSGIVFLFVGGGAQRKRIEEEARRLNINSIIFKHYQARNLLAQSLGVPDLHLITLKPELEGSVVPSKLYGILAAGKPVLNIGDFDGEVARILKEGNCGKTVPVGGVMEAKTYIKSLMLCGERLATDGKKARAIFERRFDQRIALAAWKSVIANYCHDC